MKRKSSKPPEPQEGLPIPYSLSVTETGDTARVSVTVAAPDADQIEEWIKHPANRSKFAQQFVKYAEDAPLIEKAKKRAEVEKHTIAKANLERKQVAQADHQMYRDIVLKLIRQKPELRLASQERLAQDVREVLARRGIKKSTRTIKRGLPPQK